VEVTVVGCSGSVPGPESPASCYLVRALDPGGRRWQVLLDLGSGALGALQRHTDPRSLDAVVLSHLHPDHCLDLTALQVLRRHAPVPATGELPVWGPPGADERMARAHGVLQPEPLTGMVFGELVDRRPVEVGPFTLTPYAVRHPVPAFGLAVAAGGRVLAYTGDTDSCPGLVALLAGADLALVEAGFTQEQDREAERGVHLTGERAAQAVVEAGGVGRVLLTHLPPWAEPDAVRAQARAVWDGPLDLARAGRTYPV
jgi:ribonuclease BN (tRNA processing enzyme)